MSDECQCPRKRQIPAHMSRNVRVFVPDFDELMCPTCGKQATAERAVELAVEIIEATNMEVGK